MSLIAPAIQTVSPSFMEPATIIQYSQVSGAFEMLPSGEPKVKLATDDLGVYAKRLDLRTKMASGQAAYNELPSVEPVFSLIFTPTYLTRVRYEFDHHDAAASGRWGHSITDLYRHGTLQAHFQFMRTALIFGVNPQLSEGIANAAGTTAALLPADSNGNTTITTYDNGQMALYLLQQIAAIKTKTNNFGIGRQFTILAPQRILAQWEYNIVQLVQFQRIGAGTESTAGTVKLVAGYNEDDIRWCADDTLIAKGSSSTDLIIIVMPEIELVKPPGAIDTNEFAKVTPAWMECTAMYCDMVQPREITTPVPGGAVDTLSEHRISSGWAIRPEAVFLLSAPYP